MQEFVTIVLVIFAFATVVTIFEWIYIMFLQSKRHNKHNQDVIYRMDPKAKGESDASKCNETHEEER